MAASLSKPHPERPFEQTGKVLGADQFAADERWMEAGLMALVGFGVEPGLSDIFARYAADHLFSEIDEVGVRDGNDLVVEGYEFAPTFSIWTTIEECLNPPVIWEQGRGWYTTEPFSEPEVFVFPEGMGPVECVNVEHEEVLFIPRWSSATASRSSTGWASGSSGSCARSTAGPGLERAGGGARHRGRAARRRRGHAARPGHAGRAHARPDLRGHVGHGHGQGRPAP